jgi:betaine reductase
MVKELEKAGIPTAHITNMTPVAKVTGSNRIIPGIAITNPLSDVSLSLEEQKKMRRKFIERSLKALSTDISETTFF